MRCSYTRWADGILRARRWYRLRTKYLDLCLVREGGWQEAVKDKGSLRQGRLLYWVSHFEMKMKTLRL